MITSFLDVGVDDARARANTDPDRSSSEVVVAAPDRDDEPDDDRAHVESFLGWFVQTYPTYHGGAQCTIHRTRDRALVYELLRRGRGSSVADLQAMTIKLWGITTDGVVNSDRWWIAERVTVRDIFVLHRKADFLDREVRQHRAAAESFSRRELEEAATYRRQVYGHCPHEPRHQHEAECYEEIAWWRRTSGRQQGRG